MSPLAGEEGRLIQLQWLPLQKCLNLTQADLFLTKILAKRLSPGTASFPRKSSLTLAQRSTASGTQGVKRTLAFLLRETTLRERWSAPPGQWSLPLEQLWSSCSSASSPHASSASTLQEEASDPRHRLPCPTDSPCTGATPYHLVPFQSFFSHHAHCSPTVGGAQ